jgi:putative peptidoglycan lipid II flippase
VTQPQDGSADPAADGARRDRLREEVTSHREGASATPVSATEPSAAADLGVDLTSGGGTARDSVTVGTWTIVSRATGVVRVVVIGAVLGPTFFGNTYQLTNSLPNLIYFGFLAGALFPSLLVPALVQHIDRSDASATGRISGGFLGVALTALALLAPVAVVLLPLALQLGGLGQSGTINQDQVALARWLILMMIPQVFMYAVVGTSIAVMNAHRRFALAAAAPAMENLGIIAVVGLVGWLYAGDRALGSQSTGELLLLGLGSTGAVVVHALVQWWGAHRTGVNIWPRAGWRDPDVTRVIRRSFRSLLQAGLRALQLLTLLLVANRVAGGTIALQIALNFYSLPIALAAFPVALALLPRLARIHHADVETEFADTFARGLALALFVIVPAACGTIVLAAPLAHAVAAGRMDSTAGLAMISGGLAALACGVVGETVFIVTTQAAYSRGDTRTPLLSMLFQTFICLSLCGFAVFATGTRVVVLVGSAYAAASLFGGAHLYLRVRRTLHLGDQRIWPTLLRVCIGAAAMVGPVLVSASAVTANVPGRIGWTLALVIGSFTGLVVFGLSQVLMRSPELAWLKEGFGRRTVEGGANPA